MAINEGAEFYALVYLEKEPFPQIEIRLFADKAPATVDNFIKLVREGFYDGLTFHHVVPGELVQTGDPTGTGDGGPGYVIEDEFHPDLRHEAAGIVAMANAVNPPGGTNGSQFYITLASLHDRDGLNLDGSPKDCENDDVTCHPVFGRVTRGMHLVDAFTENPHWSAIREGDKIRRIEIINQYPADSPQALTRADCTGGTVVRNPTTYTKLVQQCETLLNLKTTLAGDGKLNWNTDIPIQQWHGVHLADNGRQIKWLTLHRWGLTGTVPPEIANIDSLEYLDLSHNNLSGEIPAEIANLRGLRDLRINTNHLAGEIPHVLWDMNNLEILSLGENDLIGELPPEIANLHRLRHLNLQVN